MTQSKFIQDCMKALPREAKVIRKLYKAMKDAGKPLVFVLDEGVKVPVNTRTELLELVFNLDECSILTRDGSWVFLVMGNGWDVITDYSTDIEEIMHPVYEWTTEKELAENG